MKYIYSFNDFINETSMISDSDVRHIEDIKIDNDSNKDAESDAENYINNKSDECPRCGETTEDCECETDDPWSTQNYHRAPKGKVIQNEPKQKFKTEE